VECPEKQREEYGQKIMDEHGKDKEREREREKRLIK
jgi:hypothetical protein